MKKPQIFLWALILGLMASCNLTEEIHLREDGSGKISIHMDGSQFMELGAEEIAKNGERAVDSIIAFKDFLQGHKDSLAQLSATEQARLKRLEPFSLRMAMDPEKKQMFFDLFRDFKQVGEVNNAFNTFQDASTFGPSASPDGSALSPDQATEVSYTFGKNNFKRSVSIVDSLLFQKGVDSLQGAEMFLSGSTYTLKYHFPRRVKSTTLEGATFSADGRTLNYEIELLAWMKDPSLLDLEVVLED